MIKYAVMRDGMFVASQGNESWLQDLPIGWAYVYSLTGPWGLTSEQVKARHPNDDVVSVEIQGSTVDDMQWRLFGESSRDWVFGDTRFPGAKYESGGFPSDHLL